MVKSVGQEGLTLDAKNLLRPLPGVHRISLFKQRLGFEGSTAFWERRYASGDSSGTGSYGEIARRKADFLNAFVQRHVIGSVIEFGCGDGNQLSLASYPAYVGLDVSKTAVQLCIRRFIDDPTKSFFLYSDSCFADNANLLSADLALSLDVVYHLTEDVVFEKHMLHLFGSARHYVIIYATNKPLHDDAPHVRHRNFSSWIDANKPEWRLTSVVRGSESRPEMPDFFVYEATKD